MYLVFQELKEKVLLELKNCYVSYEFNQYNSLIFLIMEDE